MTRKQRDRVPPNRKSGLQDGFPTEEALFANNPPVLKKNKADGTYKNVAEYISTQYDLLLEDFMNPLRKSLKNFRNDPRRETYDGAKVYRKIGLEYVKKDHIFVLTGLNLSELSDQKDGKNEPPSFGRLLLFTTTNFDKDLLLGKVVCDWEETGKIEVQLREYYGSVSDVVRKKFTMMKADAFYYKYEHILDALNSFSESNFPMRDYIVYGSKMQECPSYMNINTRYVISNRVVPVFGCDWPSNEEIKLDRSQYAALKKALTDKIAVIQGPPGTGKTYFGVTLVKVLLDNISVWNPRGRTPLLVVSQSNQALDHFLEGLLKYTNKIVRIGDKSNSTLLKPYFLRELADKKIAEKKMQGKRLRYQDAAIEVQHKAHVVGLTCTGASARQKKLETLSCPIVIVEEAAEVLEADVVASMTRFCQHLILLGDHKQLKPCVTTHHLATDYDLNISLFERLMRIEVVKGSCLNTQYRMRPEISCLLVPHFYPNLKNASSTLNRPPVKGLLKSMFFLDHGVPEETIDGSTGYFNPHEVSMLIKLASYLVYVGYLPTEITIIAMYLEQRNRLIKERDLYPTLKDLEIASVDSFQGKENEIVLLSLVRSNKESNIGFLKEGNRVCVALSRAKKGLFIMGNMKCLMQKNRGKRKQSSVWIHEYQRLKDQDAIGTSLMLSCPKHGTGLEVSKPEHWDNGFCKLCYYERLQKEKEEKEAEKRRKKLEFATRNSRTGRGTVPSSSRGDSVAITIPESDPSYNVPSYSVPSYSDPSYSYRYQNHIQYTYGYGTSNERRSSIRPQNHSNGDNGCSLKPFLLVTTAIGVGVAIYVYCTSK